MWDSDPKQHNSRKKIASKFHRHKGVTVAAIVFMLTYCSTLQQCVHSSNLRFVFLLRLWRMPILLWWHKYRDSYKMAANYPNPCGNTWNTLRKINYPPCYVNYTNPCGILNILYEKSTTHHFMWTTQILVAIPDIFYEKSTTHHFRRVRKTAKRDY
jgi:hypothetical protein